MWDFIRDDVMDDLREIKQQIVDTKTLYITGISMGGGLAVISFIDINVAKIFDNIHVVTFGAPRVGNNQWAAHFDEITNKGMYRYIIKGDPIVVLPRCLTLLCTYEQTGIQRVCHVDGKTCSICIET